MGKLDGKTAYVTGSGRGIGRSVALKLASEGASVVVNDMDEGPAKAVVADIETMGGKAIAVVGSVTAPDFGARFIAAGVQPIGGVDIIVNNAGYTWDSMIQGMSDDQFDAMYDVHVKAPFRILRAAYRPISAAVKDEKEQGIEVIRKVVNISSVAGTSGNPGQVNYSSAKSAVLGMTKTLSKEWGRLKVNVNCVAFGYIETRMTVASDNKQELEIDGNRIQVGIPEKVAGMLKAMIPMGRSGSTEEAAGGVYLFCCPESNYVSGQTLIVGGGISI